MPSLDSWENLDRYRAYVRVRARRLALDPRLKVHFDESDLVRETFVRALRAETPCAGESPGARLAYLDQIFDNAFVDHLRKYQTDKRDLGREQAVRQALDESTAAYRLEPADGGASPSEQAAGREEFLRAMEAIEELPERARNVIILVYFEHCSLKEAAERLGLTNGAAAGLYGRGMTQLRGKLNLSTGDRP